MPPDEQSVATLRAKAARARRHAKHLEHDEAGPRLLALAEKWEARAKALEAAGRADKGSENHIVLP